MLSCYYFDLDRVNFYQMHLFPQNHWFTYDEQMSIESITKSVSNLALQFGEEDSEPGAMVISKPHCVKRNNFPYR